MGCRYDTPSRDESYLAPDQESRSVTVRLKARGAPGERP
jgi:hypothetical protein